MQPLLRDGDLALVNKWVYVFRKPKIGDIAVFRSPENQEQLFCKRIAGIENGSFIMSGENQNDSLKLPAVSRKFIMGKVIGW